jgi:hypothetical protein
MWGKGIRGSPPGRGLRLPPLSPLLFPVVLVVLLAWAPCGSQAREQQPALQLLRPNDERNRTGLGVVESTLAFIEALEVGVVVGCIIIDWGGSSGCKCMHADGQCSESIRLNLLRCTRDDPS